MKKSKGFVDPFTLGFIVTLGIGSIGVVTGQNTDTQQQMAQDSEIQSELAKPEKKEPKA